MNEVDIDSRILVCSNCNRKAFNVEFTQRIESGKTERKVTCTCTGCGKWKEISRILYDEQKQLEEK